MNVPCAASDFFTMAKLPHTSLSTATYKSPGFTFLHRTYAYTYPGAQVEFQTGRIISVRAYTAAGVRFIHSQVWNMLPNTTLPVGEIFMGYPVRYLWRSLRYGVYSPLSRVQEKVLFSVSPDTPHPQTTPWKWAFMSYFVRTIYCNRHWNNSWDEIRSGGEKKKTGGVCQRWKLYRYIKAICGQQLISAVSESFKRLKIKKIKK